MFRNLVFDSTLREFKVVVGVGVFLKNIIHAAISFKVFLSLLKVVPLGSSTRLAETSVPSKVKSTCE